MLTGLVTVLDASTAAAAVYVVIIILAPPVMVYSFCTKCECREHSCAHVLPGMLAARMPERSGNTYTVQDVAGVAIPALLLFLFPQYWLAQRPMMLLLFWVLACAGLFEIRLFVCKKCGNTICPFCDKAGRQVE